MYAIECVCTNGSMPVFRYTCMFACLSVCLPVCLSVCLSVWNACIYERDVCNICTYVCVHVCVYLCMRLCV